MQALYGDWHVIHGDFQHFQHCSQCLSEYTQFFHYSITHS